MKDRLVWADILRILAIFLVICVHTATLPKNFSSDALLPIFYFAFAKSCVPLFFMLSGALLLGKKENELDFFKKRFLRIFRPFLFWTIIFVFFLIIITPPASFSQFITTVKIGLRVFWFMPILFCLYLVAPALRIFTAHAKNTQLALVLTLWFLLISLIPFLRNTLAFPIRASTDIVNLTINFSGYFLLGYFLLRSRFLSLKLQSFLLIIVGVIWTTLGTFFLSKESLNLTYFEYTSPSIILTSIGIFNLFFLSEDFFKRRLSQKTKKTLAGVSMLIFGVYLLHTVNLQIFERLHIPLSFSPFPILSAIILFLATLCIVFLLSKIPFLKKFVS